MSHYRRVIIGADEVTVGNRLRSLREDAIAPLMESIKKLGQQTPIAILQTTDGYRLVAGLHRLTACERLGEPVTCDVFTDDRGARLREIAENLHRADLTTLERAEHLDEWRKLTLEKANAQVGHSDHTGGKPNRGHSATAKEFGTTRQEVERAEAIAAITKEAKSAFREAGLDDGRSQSALLTIARKPEAEQVAAVREIAERKAAPKPEPEVRRSAAAEIADIITDRVPPSLVSRIKELLAITTSSAIAKELA